MLSDEGVVYHFSVTGLERVRPVDLATEREWYAIAVSRGVAWVTGENGLGRIVPDGRGGVVFEATWLDRVGPEIIAAISDDGVLRLGGARAYCPDFVRLAGGRGTSERSEVRFVTRHRVWELRPEPSGASPLRLVVDAQSNNLGEDAPFGAEASIAILGTDRRPIVIWSGGPSSSGTVFRHGVSRAAAPFSKVLAGAQSSEQFVLGGDRGAIAIGHFWQPN